MQDISDEHECVGAGLQGVDQAAGQLEIGAVLHFSWCRVSFSGMSSKDALSTVVLQDAASSTNVLPWVRAGVGGCLCGTTAGRKTFL